ncbi:MAG: hypothetical protein HOP12_01235 [Candidatus Eisenbacteria bacterium]|uniref:histidine kinase n=1 Tax=Eiseniibacteriota bacterium TaxID=2212470 RepID=A0A849SMV8_UNCEI|nr:hypothetical protein [Candidatus Eisenbacteria bacterium]
MPDGGSLRIEVSNIELKVDQRPPEPSLRYGHDVVVTVADTGIGMNEEVRSRIFEPFFTTKATGKGTGLGLSTVYGIVKQTGGQVVVRSSPDCGSSFRLYLPRADGVPRAIESRPVKLQLPRGAGRQCGPRDPAWIRRSARSAAQRCRDARNEWPRAVAAGGGDPPLGSTVADVRIRRRRAAHAGHDRSAARVPAEAIYTR